MLLLQFEQRRRQANFSPGLERSDNESQAMPSIGLEEEIQVGDEVVLSSGSSSSNYGVVFEDDGKVGYLYAIKFRGENYNILDAMHVYNVSSVVDREKPSTIKILWSDNGLKAALLINDYPHAVFDFATHQGFCRTNFPSPGPKWTRREWSDQVIECF